jgi:hypothetical protein
VISAEFVFQIARLLDCYGCLSLMDELVFSGTCRGVVYLYIKNTRILHET